MKDRKDLHDLQALQAELERLWAEKKAGIPGKDYYFKYCPGNLEAAMLISTIDEQIHIWYADREERRAPMGVRKVIADFMQEKYQETEPNYNFHDAVLLRKFRELVRISENEGGGFIATPLLSLDEVFKEIAKKEIPTETPHKEIPIPSNKVPQNNWLSFFTSKLQTGTEKEQQRKEVNRPKG